MLNRPGFPWASANSERYSLIRGDLCRGISPVEYVESLAMQTAQKASQLDSDTPEQIKMREMFMLNFYWFMQTLLTRKDRCSMAHGLEVRVPFCDHRIAQYAYNIPPEIKFLEGRGHCAAGFGKSTAKRCGVAQKVTLSENTQSRLHKAYA